MLSLTLCCLKVTASVRMVTTSIVQAFVNSMVKTFSQHHNGFPSQQLVLLNSEQLLTLSNLSLEIDGSIDIAH